MLNPDICLWRRLYLYDIVYNSANHPKARFKRIFFEYSKTISCRLCFNIYYLKIIHINIFLVFWIICRDSFRLNWGYIQIFIKVCNLFYIYRIPYTIRSSVVGHCIRYSIFPSVMIVGSFLVGQKTTGLARLTVGRLTDSLMLGLTCFFSQKSKLEPSLSVVFLL